MKSLVAALGLLAAALVSAGVAIHAYPLRAVTSARGQPIAEATS